MFGFYFDEELDRGNPEAIEEIILSRDMIRIGLRVISRLDGTVSIFPSPANYHELTNLPYSDSRTHWLQNDGTIGLRDQLEFQDVMTGYNGPIAFRMCSMVPTPIPWSPYQMIRHGYSWLNDAGNYRLTCPVCGYEYQNYHTFFVHCYHNRIERYPSVTSVQWTNLTDNPRELHDAIANVVKRERERITQLFFRKEIARILRSQPSFRLAPIEVIDYIIDLSYTFRI